MMEALIPYLLLLAGLALIVGGADILVDGSSSIARRAGISEFVIGLTIVGFGTSCPELVVSLNGAIKGLADISVGNVVGSNIFNTLLILGVTALIAPIPITESNRRTDIPVCLFVTLLLLFFGLYNADISRLEGIIFMCVFAAYIYFCFKTGKSIEETDEEGEAAKPKPVWLAIILTVAGLAALVFGGKLFVDAATTLARSWGVSDKFIAVTLLAGGTSLPELATCVVAAFKRKGQLALGNILGSNVFNILLILGTSAVVTPLRFVSISAVDLAVMLAAVLLVFTSSYTGKRDLLDRFDAALLLLVEAGYLAWLFITL